MKHPSTEELLLLTEADEHQREATAHTAAHLDSCAACRATLGELLGVLTAATSEMRANVLDSSAEEDVSAWARLEAAIVPATSAPHHLAPYELLLSVDGDLDTDRTAHLEACAVCCAELLRTHQLLAEIEHELRDLVEDESLSRRAAALAELEARIEAVPVSAPSAPARVVEFPSVKPRPVVWQTYAAAAALAGLTFGGLYYAQSGSVQQPTTTAAAIEAASEAPRLLVEQPIESVSEPVAVAQASVQTVVSSPANAQGAAPSVLEPSALETYEIPSVTPDAPASARALSAAPVQLASSLTATVESTPWAPSWQAPRLLAPVQEAAAPRLSAPTASLSVGDRVVGGVVRTALLAHYRDAARRSFQSPEPPALEGELARFVTGVYRNQSELLRHAYEFNRLVTAPDDESDRKQLQKSARTYLRRVAEHERAIYDGLAETLPRKFWAAHSGEEAPAAESAELEAQLLLSDALRLEETLTTLFNRPASSLDASLDRTPGELLDRIETRIRRLRVSLDTL